MCSSSLVYHSCSHVGIADVVEGSIREPQQSVYIFSTRLPLLSKIVLIHGTPFTDHTRSAHRHPRLVRLHAASNRIPIRHAETYALPVHCTGFRTKVTLGDGCIPASSGVGVKVVGDRAMEEHMFAPPVVRAVGVDCDVADLYPRV